MGCGMSDTKKEQLALSTSATGLGLRNITTFASASFLACSMSAMTIASLLVDDDVRQLCEPVLLIQRQAALADYNDRVAAEQRIVDLEHFPDATTQRTLTSAIDKCTMKRVFASAPKRHRAWLLSMQGKKAGCFLRVLPNRQYGHQYDNAQMRVIFQMRLGLPIMEQQCCLACGERMDTYGYHALICADQNSRFERHDGMTRGVSRVLNEGGIRNVVERRDIFGTDNNKMPADVSSYE